MKPSGTVETHIQLAGNIDRYPIDGDYEPLMETNPQRKPFDGVNCMGSVYCDCSVADELKTLARAEKHL